MEKSPCAPVYGLLSVDSVNFNIITRSVDSQRSNHSFNQLYILYVLFGSMEQSAARVSSVVD